MPQIVFNLEQHLALKIHDAKSCFQAASDESAMIRQTANVAWDTERPKQLPSFAVPQSHLPPPLDSSEQAVVLGKPTMSHCGIMSFPPLQLLQLRQTQHNDFAMCG